MNIEDLKTIRLMIEIDIQRIERTSERIEPLTNEALAYVHALSQLEVALACVCRRLKEQSETE